MTKLLSIEKSQTSAASSILNTDPDFPLAAEFAFTLQAWLAGAEMQVARWFHDQSIRNMWCLQAGFCRCFGRPKIFVDMISRGYNLNGLFLSIWLSYNDNTLDPEVNMEAVKISPKYQVVISKKIKESLQLKPGRQMQVIEYGNRVEFIPIKSVKYSKKQ